MLGGLPYEGVFMPLRLAGKGGRDKGWAMISVNFFE